MQLSRFPWSAHLKALLSLDKLVLRQVPQPDSARQISRVVGSSGAYRISLLFRYRGPGRGRFVVKLDGAVIGALPVSDRQRFTTYLVEIPRSGLVTIGYEADFGADLIVIGLGLRKVADLPRTSFVNVQPSQIAAAIATYPARQHVLNEAVSSLVQQVDYLFVYLNNYRHIPDYLLEYDTDKVHYILDTASQLRASAKFHWIRRHRCYWLICDDDIIYPDDYVRRMKEAHASCGRGAVVGVHGTIFDPRFENYYSSRVVDHPFEAALERHTQVHMLGTGTLFLHSDQLGDAECDLLLSHPTENDETFALICRRNGTKQFAVRREAGWMRSNPKMKHGLFEETMLDPAKQKRLTALLAGGNPWPMLQAHDEGRLKP